MVRPTAATTTTTANGDLAVPSPLVCSVGVIADIQYAPIPDGTSYAGTPRYYRHALEATGAASKAFAEHPRNRRSSGKGGRGGVDLVVNLGDIVDGKCQDVAANGGLPYDDEAIPPGLQALSEVLRGLKPYGKTKTTASTSGNGNGNDPAMLHIYGNHCLYNLNRSEIRRHLGIPLFRETGDDSTIHDDQDDDEDLVGYYSYVYPPPVNPEHEEYGLGVVGGGSCEKEATASAAAAATTSIRFVCLDTYDVSVLARSPEGNGSRKHAEAAAVLSEENPINFAKGGGAINSPEGLEGVQKRFVAFGGGVGRSQLEWLRSELRAAREAASSGDGDGRRRHRQKVVILSHQPIHPDSSNPVCLVWNYPSVLDLLREYSDVVVASFAGHAHRGGYALDAASKIHFRVVEAVLESPPPVATFGILDVYDDRLELTGHGDCESAVYRFRDDDETTTGNDGAIEWEGERAETASSKPGEEAVAVVS